MIKGVVLRPEIIVIGELSTTRLRSCIFSVFNSKLQTFLKNRAIDPVFFGFNIASLSGVAGADVIFTGLGRGDRGGLPLVDFTGLTGSVAGAPELSRNLCSFKIYYLIS